MAITRVTAVWSGFTGAPGYTSFHFTAFDGGLDTTDEVGRVHAFFTALGGIIPGSVEIQVRQETELLNEASGELLGYGGAAAPVEPVDASGSNTYAAPSGGLVTWNTNTVHNGRRLRGRTFIVPLTNTAYQGDGTLTEAAIGTMGTAAEALIGDGTGSQLVVWSRPSGASAGAEGPVTGYRIPDMAAVLRSRRD